MVATYFIENSVDEYLDMYDCELMDKSILMVFEGYGCCNKGDHSRYFDFYTYDVSFYDC